MYGAIEFVEGVNLAKMTSANEIWFFTVDDCPFTREIAKSSET